MRLDRENAARQRGFIDRTCPRMGGHARRHDGTMLSIRGNSWQALTGETFIVWKHPLHRWCVAGQQAGDWITVGHGSRGDAMIEANRRASVARGAGP